MKRRATIALCALTLVGCKNMGLDDPGTGEEGRNRAPTDLVSSVHRAAPAATQPVIVDGRRWVPTGRSLTLDAAELRSVGSSAGQTVYARQWDEAPFDLLFIPSQPGRASGTSGPSTEAEWQQLVPVIGEDGGPPALDEQPAPEAQAAPEGETAPEESTAPEEPAAEEPAAEEPAAEDPAGR